MSRESKEAEGLEPIGRFRSGDMVRLARGVSPPYLGRVAQLISDYSQRTVWCEDSRRCELRWGYDIDLEPAVDRDGAWVTDSVTGESHMLRCPMRVGDKYLDPVGDVYSKTTWDALEKIWTPGRRRERS